MTKLKKEIFTIDLGNEESLHEINEAEILDSPLDKLVVFLPLPCFGRSNSHLDLRDDLLYASFAAELLAVHAKLATAEFTFSNPDHLERIKLTMQKPSATIILPLRECFIVFNPDTDEHNTFEDKYAELWSRISDFEDKIDSIDALVPEIADWYFAELIGSYYEIESDAPDFFLTEISAHPERRLHFFKSAYSSRLGAKCFASQDSWLVPAEMDLDKFFQITGQKYSSSEFESGDIFLTDNTTFAISQNQMVYLPLNQYFKSRAAASLIEDEALIDDQPLKMERFDWIDATFTHSPFRNFIQSRISDDFRAPAAHKADCLIHQSGDLIYVNDGLYAHLLYDTKPLNMHQAKFVLDATSNLAGKISDLVGLAKNISCDWKKIDDEKFESLCYDILYAHPKFDAETLQKIGKSRSRDGGRDIIVYERSTGSERPRKWIFQCKLITDGASLSARKLLDVGDMLEQHGAQGFGVMTSAVIDATLYDKLESLCKKRGVEERHFSVFELERALARQPNVRCRYFGF